VVSPDEMLNLTQPQWLALSLLVHVATSLGRRSAGRQELRKLLQHPREASSRLPTRPSLQNRPRPQRPAHATGLNSCRESLHVTVANLSGRRVDRHGTFAQPLRVHERGTSVAVACHMTTSTPTREQLVTKLNEDLAREYRAVIAYIVYSQVLKGAEYMAIAKELEAHATQELQHAITITKHIDYLGGIPTVQPPAVKSRSTRSISPQRWGEGEPDFSPAGRSAR
jgi:hypothetical protein